MKIDYETKLFMETRHIYTYVLIVCSMVGMFWLLRTNKWTQVCLQLSQLVDFILMCCPTNSLETDGTSRLLAMNSHSRQFIIEEIQWYVARIIHKIHYDLELPERHVLLSDCPIVKHKSTKIWTEMWNGILCVAKMQHFFLLTNWPNGRCNKTVWA